MKNSTERFLKSLPALNRIYLWSPASREHMRSLYAEAASSLGKNPYEFLVDPYVNRLLVSWLATPPAGPDAWKFTPFDLVGPADVDADEREILRAMIRRLP